MMTFVVAKCADCGARPHVGAEYRGWSVVCRNCYDADFDGERYHSTNLVAWGRTPIAAIEDWNEQTFEKILDKGVDS